MITLLLSALLFTTSTDASCPPINFDELQPPRGEEFVYSFWRDGGMQPGALRIEIGQSRAGQVRAEMSYLLVNGQWTPPATFRAFAGVILRSESELGGSSPRQLSIRSVSPPIMSRSLSEGDEVRIPAVETVTDSSGETLRHQGEYVISHAGCGELIHDGESVQTRRLRVSYFRFIGQPEEGWTLTNPVQIYDIPVGANWFYALHREANHPMQQGTVMEGYTAP
ncbi:hypothetical protein [uncultured Maricaulis sp.]|uniref:hypothetical protein n=1 Tax=uncultured Maricaulis sp. TaxID=174710 RepID=UPI0030DC99E9